MASALIQCVTRTQTGWMSGRAARSGVIDTFVAASLLMTSARDRNSYNNLPAAARLTFMSRPVESHNTAA